MKQKSVMVNSSQLKRPVLLLTLVTLGFGLWVVVDGKSSGLQRTQVTYGYPQEGIEGEEPTRGGRAAKRSVYAVRDAPSSAKAPQSGQLRLAFGRNGAGADDEVSDSRAPVPSATATAALVVSEIPPAGEASTFPRSETEEADPKAMAPTPATDHRTPTHSEKPLQQAGAADEQNQTPTPRAFRRAGPSGEEDGATEPTVFPEESGQILGQVVERLSGEGLPDLAVICSGQTGPPVSTRTQAGGVFAFWLAPGDYYVAVQGDDAQHYARVESSDVTMLHIEVDTGTEVSGYVRSEGEPIPNVLVRLFRLSPRREQLDETLTDTSGFYALVYAPVQQRLLVTAELPGYAGDARELTIPDTRPVDRFDLELAFEGRIFGTVRNAAGQPVAGVRVTAESNQQVWAEFGTRVTTTDAAGSYVVPGIKPGQWMLRYEAQGYAVKRQMAIVSRLKPSLQVDITLATGASIAGRVVRDSDGQPLSQVTVTISYGAEQAVVETGPDGAFRFESVSSPQGNIYVVARHEAYSTTPYLEVHPGDEGLLIRMVPRVTWVLRVLDREGGVVQRYFIQFKPYAVPNDQFANDPPGGREIKTDLTAAWELNAARYRIEIHAPDVGSAAFDIDLRSAPGRVVEYEAYLR